jgi:hypothetical protein
MAILNEGMMKAVGYYKYLPIDHPDNGSILSNHNQGGYRN